MGSGLQETSHGEGFGVADFVELCRQRLSDHGFHVASQFGGHLLPRSDYVGVFIGIFPQVVKTFLTVFVYGGDVVPLPGADRCVGPGVGLWCSDGYPHVRQVVVL